MNLALWLFDTITVSLAVYKIEHKKPSIIHESLYCHNFNAMEATQHRNITHN